MRIIAGDLKGRKLIAPDGDAVRPTADKVKGAVFNMLANQIEDATVLDLFAGTGNLGLEALSWGAKRCYFCDSGNNSIGIIRANIAKLGVEDRATVIPGDYRRALARIAEPLDVVFLDPPYGKGLAAEVLRSRDLYGKLAPEAVVVVESQGEYRSYDRSADPRRRRRIDASQDAAEEIFPYYTLVKTRSYGKTVIDVYWRSDL